MRQPGRGKLRYESVAGGSRYVNPDENTLIRRRRLSGTMVDGKRKKQGKLRTKDEERKIDANRNESRFNSR